MPLAPFESSSAFGRALMDAFRCGLEGAEPSTSRVLYTPSPEEQRCPVPSGIYANDLVLTVLPLERWSSSCLGVLDFLAKSPLKPPYPKAFDPKFAKSQSPKLCEARQRMVGSHGEPVA